MNPDQYGAVTYSMNSDPEHCLSVYSESDSVVDILKQIVLMLSLAAAAFTV